MNIVQLGNHVNFVSGYAFKSKNFNDRNEGLPVIRIRDVKKGFSETYTTEDYDSKYIIEKGDYLIGMDGEFNLSKWKSSKALLNQRVCKIGDVSEEIHLDYLAKYLPVLLKEIERKTPFVTVKHLSVKTLNLSKIPLPPLPEQKRIASILDAADALRTKRRQAIAMLDELLQATFLDMFGDPVTNPKGWEVKKLGDFVEKLLGGKNIAQAEYVSSFKVLKVSAVTSGIYKPEESKYLPDDYQFPAEYLVHKNDLLISRANTTELIGATAFVWNTPENIVLPDKIWKFVWKNIQEINPLFVFAYTNQAEFRRQVSNRCSGTSGSMKNIAKPKLLSIPIYVPPLSLQIQFAKIVEKVQAQKAVQQAHLAELDTLFASLQQRAFAGAL